METQNFKIESANSNIDWIGRKVTGAHNGTIGIKEGGFTFVNGQLANGKVIIDTTAIKILDIEDAVTNAQFAGHLASDDFFSSAQHPQAVFAITSATAIAPDNYHVAGDLTIKGITNTIAFDAKINIVGNTLTLTGKALVDRTKFGMKFRSGNFFQNLGDTLIYNDFELTFQVTAKAASTVSLN